MNNMIMYLIYIAGGLLALIAVAFFILNKKNNTKEMKQS